MRSQPQMHPSFRGARCCEQIPLEKVKWGSVRNGRLGCTRTFCFWTFWSKLFIGETFIAQFVCSHQKGAWVFKWGSDGLLVGVVRHPADTGLPVRTVPWADPRSVTPGVGVMDRVKMPLPLRNSSLRSPSDTAHFPPCPSNLIISAYPFSRLCILEMCVLQIPSFVLREMDPFLHLLSI